MQISRRNTQFELGISDDFFTLPYKKYKYFVTKTWLTHLWNYTSKCNASIHHTHHQQYKLPRKNDFFIMDEVFQSDISNEYKRIFNLVRQKLQVLTASDIVLAGTSNRICPELLQCINHRASTLKWPNVGTLPKQWKQIWNSILLNIILPKLHSLPLGRWERPSHQKWHYHTNATKDFVTHKNTTYERCHHLRRSRYKQSLQTYQGSWIADVSKCSNGDIICESHAKLPC